MKKITKTLTLLALSLCLMLSLIGCGGAPADDAVDEKLTVGVVQLIDNGAFEDMREGFIARLQELGYTEDNPTGAGIITDMAHPDKNATGTSNAIPVSEMFKLADRLTPGCQTYGLLYTTGEINAVTTINDAKAYMDANGIKYVEKVVSNSSEVQQAAQSLVGSVDAIFCPNDSVVQAAMPQIAQIAREAKIPVYGSSAVMVNSGAFATISISDTEIGAISADMADQILKGTPVSEVPAKVVDVFTTVINQNTADAIGASLSDDVKANAVLVEDSAQ